MNETTSRVFLFYEIYSVQSRNVTLETKKKMEKKLKKEKEKSKKKRKKGLLRHSSPWELYFHYPIFEELQLDHCPAQS
jgi:hypothetical protein